MESESEARGALTKRLDTGVWQASLLCFLAGVGGYVTVSGGMAEAFTLTGALIGLLGLIVMEMEVRDV